MEPERFKWAVTVFSFLMKQDGNSGFVFPKGRSVIQSVSSCLEALNQPGRERIVDFCVCQVYAISRFDEQYCKQRWKPSHSFGKKALERFTGHSEQHRYYENAWLQEIGVDRKDLLALITDRKDHPQAKFIFAAYEERTKRRCLSTKAGYYICEISTLMWSPFSPSCQQCRYAEECRKRTQKAYPELYRIRVEQFSKEPFE